MRFKFSCTYTFTKLHDRSIASRKWTVMWCTCWLGKVVATVGQRLCATVFCCRQHSSRPWNLLTTTVCSDCSIPHHWRAPPYWGSNSTRSICVDLLLLVVRQFFALTRVGSINISKAGLISLEKQGWVLWILHGPQNPRPHGDGTQWGHTRWVTR